MFGKRRKQLEAVFSSRVTSVSSTLGGDEGILPSRWCSTAIRLPRSAA